MLTVDFKKVKFDDLPIPDDNDKEEIENYVNKFDEEFGDDYMLDPWIDPSSEIDDDFKYKYTKELDMKFERIKRRKKYKKIFDDAINNNDIELLRELNKFRQFSYMYDDDDGWNYSALQKQNKVEQEERGK